MPGTLDHVRLKAEGGDDLARRHLEGVARLRAGVRPARTARDLRLDLVMGCPHRGGVLGLSQQPQGCCGGPELTGCRAGKGKDPGRVSLADCLGCVEAPPDPSRSVLLFGYLRGGEGYGRVTRALGAALEGRGIPARCLSAIPLDDVSPPDPWMAARVVGGAEADAWGAAIHLQVPESRRRPGRKKLAFTMSESTRARPDQVAGLDDSEMVVVPTEANAGWFRDSGVTAPIRVVPLGLTDPGAFATREGWVPSGPTRFALVGRQAHGTRRKNLAGGIAAFLRAFDAGEDVRLEVLATDAMPLEHPGDPRVTIRRGIIPSAAMGEWYRSFDALFTPTRGEGWGMHQHEAAACGVPVIAPIWGGLAAFLAPGDCYPVAYSLAPTGEEKWAGEWAEPEPESMVAQLRAVHRDREAAARVGRRPSERARGFTWERAAEDVAGIMRELGMLDERTSLRKGA